MSNNMTSNDKQFTTEFLGFTGDFEYARDSEDRLTGNNDFIGVTYCTAVSGYEETTEIEGVIDDFSKNIITLTRDDGAEVTIEPDFEKDTVGAPAIVRTNGRKVGEIEHDGFETGYTLMRVDHLAMMESEDEETEEIQEETHVLTYDNVIHDANEVTGVHYSRTTTVEVFGIAHEDGTFTGLSCDDPGRPEGEFWIENDGEVHHRTTSGKEYPVGDNGQIESIEQEENDELSGSEEKEAVTDGGAERPLGLEEAGDALKAGADQIGELTTEQINDLSHEGVMADEAQKIVGDIGVYSYLIGLELDDETYESACSLVEEVLSDVVSAELTNEGAEFILRERGENLSRVGRIAQENGAVQEMEIELDEIEESSEESESIKVGQIYDNGTYQIEIGGVGDETVEAIEGDRVEFIDIEKFRTILKQEGYRLLEDYEQHAADLLEELEAEEEGLETDGGSELVRHDYETGQVFSNGDRSIEITDTGYIYVAVQDGDRVVRYHYQKLTESLGENGFEEVVADGGEEKSEFEEYVRDQLDEILSKVESDSQGTSDGDESHESESEEESSEWSLSDAQELAKLIMNRNPQYREYHVNDDLDLIFEYIGDIISGYHTGFMEEHGYRVDFMDSDIIVFTLIEASNRPKIMTDGGSPLPPEEEDFRHGKPEDSGKECRLMTDGGIPKIGASQLFTEDQEREIVYLNIIKRLSQREISMLCNCSQGTISRIVARYQSIGSDALKESIKSEYENQENRTFGREIEEEEIKDRWSEEFEETFLSEPIKVRWMGSLRDRISERHDGYTRNPDSKDYDEHSVRCFRVLSREHSQIVIKSQEEADAFLLMMRQYNTPGIHWMSVGMLNCAKRVCDEVREQLDTQAETAEIDSSDSDQEVMTDGGETQ